MAAGDSLSLRQSAGLRGTEGRLPRIIFEAGDLSVGRPIFTVQPVPPRGINPSMKNPFPGMKSRNNPLFLAGFALFALTAPLAFAQPNEQRSGLETDKAAPAYPLKKSANGRYLVDQNGAPFLLAGESPQ